MITIRQADLSDFSVIYNFINQLENQVFDPETQRQIFIRNLSDDKVIYLVAHSDNEPAGFVSCHIQWLLHHAAPIAEIQEMFVSEKFRSSGIGKRMMEELIKNLSTKNIRQIEVTSNKKREQAHRFYLREGFIQSHFKFTRSL